MRLVQIQEIQRRVKDRDFNSRYEQMSRRSRRETDALQACRWRKPNRRIDISSYLDN